MTSGPASAAPVEAAPGLRLHLAYHMCISWQWPLWALWLTLLPLLIFTDLWFGALGIGPGVALYLFANDGAPGDVNGQGVGDVWYVVGPDGEIIRD